MNFCLFLSVLVVVSLGPWATAKDVPLHLGKSSGKEGAAEETKRKAGGDAGVPLINGVVQVASKARDWTQWLRRLLKALKRWCHAHPPEVKLGKCFASYFNVEILGGRRLEKTEVGRNDASGTIKQRKTSKMYVGTGGTAKGRKVASERSGFKWIALLWKGFISWVAGFLREAKRLFLQYRGVVLGNDFAACVWEYMLKKFWMWVDSAPDPRYRSNAFK